MDQVDHHRNPKVVKVAYGWMERGSRGFWARAETGR